MAQHTGVVLGAGGVAVWNDSILLIRKGRGPAQGVWMVPGGKVELGEPVAVAVVREVFEETGLEVVVEQFLGWVERIDDDQHFVILDFTVTPLDPTAALVAGDDAAEARWVPLSEVSELRLVDGLYEFLHDHNVL
ncbi:MAG: NUDIX domain-containing protein [Acidimicrobiia bacterium]